MRIAFTHNLRRVDAEEQAEFDTPDTVAAIIAALTHLGLDVFPVDVNVPVGERVAELERLKPDRIFNKAEGTPFRGLGGTTQHGGGVGHVGGKRGSSLW